MSIDQLDLFENTLPEPHSVPIEQGDHSVGLQQEAKSSIDERFAAITISNSTLALLQSIAHGRTMNRVIKELYEAFIFNLAKERGEIHD
jgi:predicted transcriptional regulator YdeE